MRLMIDTDADPVAVHTPIPVPIHWRDAVKAGIDQDIKLGVLEAVPIGQPGDMPMLSDLQLVYMVAVPRNFTQLLNINTTKFQVEREPVYVMVIFSFT